MNQKSFYTHRLIHIHAMNQRIAKNILPLLINVTTALNILLLLNQYRKIYVKKKSAPKNQVDS